MARNLRETFHSTAYRERLSAAWALLATWFSNAFPGCCVDTIKANLSCVVHVLGRYVLHLYGMGYKIILGVETISAVRTRYRGHKG